MTEESGAPDDASKGGEKLRLSGLRSLPMVRQTEATECGLACLAMVAGYYGYDTDLASLRRRFSVSAKGATLRNLVEIAGVLGFGARALRFELDEISELRAPCILHWDLSHFVVLKRVRGDRIVIHDPAMGIRRMKLSEANEHLTGVALELTPTPQFQRKTERQPIRLTSMIRLGPAAWSSLVQGLILSVILELVILANPFFLQLVIDEAILRGDTRFLVALALAFGALALFQVAVSIMRSLVFQYFGQVLSFDMQASVFHHMVRLPLEFFSKRHVGDIQQRFETVQPIQQFLVEGGITGLIDGVLGIVVLIVLYLYSPALATVVFVAFLLYAVLRLVLLFWVKRLTGDFLVADAKERTRFLESVRGMQTLKASGAELGREQLWRNAAGRTVNTEIRLGNVNIGFEGLKTGIFGLTDVIVIAAGAMAALNGELTVGMLTAFVAYKGQFIQRGSSLLEQIIAYKLLDVQLERLADIALNPREQGIDDPGEDGEMEGRIELRNIAFRYSPQDDWVLRGVNLAIAPGDFVAITGPSGAGKTTMLKVMAGLYRPTAGDVIYDGRPADHWGPRALRRQVAMVLQDDQLLEGSIAENIAMFDDEIDMDRVRECARLAAVDQDIEAFPMAYQSFVGDMGSTLSGGQKQRVIIARALYRQPKVLLMDEGTSQLDSGREGRIHQSLTEMNITRVVIAHRKETVAIAKRVLMIENGQLREAPPQQPDPPEPPQTTKYRLV